MQGKVKNNLKSRLNIVLRVFVIITVLLALIPLPYFCTDGGTMQYIAVLYRVRIWHSAVYDSSINSVTYLKGTDILIFPFNYLCSDNYYDRPNGAKFYIAPFVHW